MQNITQYQFLHSRTFWTLVFMFAYNLFQFFMPSIPAGIDTIVDFLFTSLATYFHIAGVNNAVQTSLTLGKPANGQN